MTLETLRRMITPVIEQLLLAEAGKARVWTSKGRIGLMLLPAAAAEMRLAARKRSH